MMPSAVGISPQQIDPLSWFTRSLVPLTFSATLFVFSLGSILVGWRELAMPIVDLVAMIVLLIAGFVVQARTRPFRPPFSARRAILPLAITVAALALDTWANLESTVPVQFWWAPVGVAVVIGTLAPYSSARNILGYGAVLTVLTGVASIIGFAGPSTVWPPLTTALIGASSVIAGTAASAVFSFAMVSRTQLLFAGAGTVTPPDAIVTETAANTVERTTVARLGTRVAPFLARIAEGGEVTDADRALAGQLARRLRSDLVEQANRSWLDAIVVNGRIFIVDPERRADRMNAAQRSALRGLLVAALKNPSTDAGSLFIELRGQEDGSTAVALSLDVDLPEGRRVMLLAPYYLALQMTVNDVSWDPARELLKFEVPGDR
jgi:hypothetical protein